MRRDLSDSMRFFCVHVSDVALLLWFTVRAVFGEVWGENQLFSVFVYLLLFVIITPLLIPMNGGVWGVLRE